MTYHRKLHLGVVTAALIGAMLLLLWLTPQVHSQESTGGAPEKQLTEARKNELAERMARLTQDSKEALPPEHRVDEDPKGNPYVAGELNVAYKQGVSDAAKKETLQKVNAQKNSEIPQINSQTLSFPEVKNERAQEARQKALERKKQALEQDPNVEGVSYNYVVKALATPNDPRFSSQWGLSQIQAPQAWDTETGSYTIFAVVDSGVRNDHPDINNNGGVSKVLQEWDYVEDDAVAQDIAGHGTHVAGIAGAYTNNATGIASTSPDAWILDLKALDGNGEGDSADVAAAIVHARDLGAHVINLSLGGPDNVLMEERAVDYAWSNGNGSVVVAAAGNESTNAPSYPAAYPNAIAVTATNRDHRLALFNPFTGEGSNYGAWVDVAAPGDNILSTVPTKEFPFDIYQSWSGTSMAAPFVSGVANLLASADSWTAPRLSAAEIRRRIESTACDLGPAGRDEQFGWGRVNAYSAVNAAPPDCPRVDKWVYVPESQSIVSTGINVYPNDKVIITTNPDYKISSGVLFTGQNGPAGWDNIDCAEKFPLKCSHPYSLIGQLNSQYFYVGEYYNKTARADLPSPSTLYLRVNDDAPGNGSGRFYARIQVYDQYLSPYSAVGDFSATQNPAGAWSYGYRASAGSGLALYTKHDNPYAGLDRWSPGTTTEPMVAYNSRGRTASYLTITHPPDVLNLHPGPTGQKSVVRWTAQSSGTLKIEGKFQGIDTGGTTTDVSVVHNSTTTLFGGNIKGYGARAPFSITKSVTAGDTIDFSVGYGSNATYFNDSTGLSVTITRTR
jgi:thermitase